MIDEVTVTVFPNIINIYDVILWRHIC